MTRTIHVRPHERRKPGPSADFVAKTKALAAHVMAEREWNEFVGNVLAMELDHALSELDGEQFDDLSDEQRARIRESM